MSSNTLLQGSTSLRWPNDSSSPRQFSKEESHMSHMYRKSQHTEGRCGASKSDHLEHERCPTLPFMALPGKKRCENSKWLVGGGGSGGQVTQPGPWGAHICLTHPSAVMLPQALWVPHWRLRVWLSETRAPWLVQPPLPERSIQAEFTSKPGEFVLSVYLWWSN